MAAASEGTEHLEGGMGNDLIRGSHKNGEVQYLEGNQGDDVLYGGDSALVEGG